MKRFMLVTVAICALTGSLYAQRGGRAGGGGFGAGGGNMARPMNVPQMQRPNNMQMQRPPVSMGGMNRPNMPNMNAPQMNRPSMPTMPSQPSIPNRPTTPPQINRPGGGITPGGIINPPGINPGGSPRPSFPTNRPGGNTPTVPDIGNRLPPTTLPGVNRPTTLPGTIRPGGGEGRPGTGTINRPGPGTNRPGAGVDLGLDRPIKPTPPIINPNVRPDIGQRPVRPPTSRPIVNPNINVGNQVNNVINRRPAWVNVNNVTINNIHNNWNTAINNRPNMNNWIANNPNRYRYWNGWGNNIRNHWGYYHNHNNWFGHSWWSRYHPAFCGWHYRYWFPYYPFTYWWSVPTWAGVTSWFNWGTPVWQQPIYYDYGMGGNVTYQNNTVYVGGQQVASSGDFAQSAAALATVDPPANEEQAAAVEWMPLGTFALSTGEKDTEPTRVVQLAVTKDGIIGGTLFNYQTDQSASIQGKVDRTTQRVAFRIGEKDDLVAETGMYNLTQEEVPVLVHFGTGKTENFMFVRLKDDQSNQPK